MRLSRKLGLYGGLILPSLYELWSDAVVVASFGSSSSTAQTFENLSIGDTSTPVYAIATKGDAVDITEIYDNATHWWQDWYATNDVLIMQVGVEPSGSTTASTKVYVAGGQMEDLYGYSMHILRFPSYSKDIVRTVLLRKMKIEFLENAYRYGSSASSVYIADGDLSSDPNDVYLQFACTASAGYISATRGGTPETAIMSSGSRAFWRHASSRYYFSTGGSSNSTTRAGGLYRLTM